MDKYVKIQRGSLYYTFEKLEKEGFIEVVDVVKDTNHPEKTIYGITNDGRKEFHDLLLNEFITRQYTFVPFHAAVAFINHLEKDELITDLRIRIRDEEKSLSIIEMLYKNYCGKIPMFGLYIMANTIEHNRLEIKFLERLLADAENDNLNKHEPIADFECPI
jgi:DNA-binding PadR family transcriptional regulator